MTIDPHTAERLILIGCHEAAARRHALRLALLPAERGFWLEQATTFLNDTVKYDSTTCAVFVQPSFQSWPETQAIVQLVQEHYKQARINQNTVEAIGEAQGRNLVRNLLRIVQRDGSMLDACATLPSMHGRTAIICGAGPSFEDAGRHVSGHRGPVIAVNTSAGACAQAEVFPHAVVCTESKPVREGVARMNTDRSHLAMDLIGHPSNWVTDQVDDEGARGHRALENLCFIGTEPNLAPYAYELGLLPLAYGSSCTTAAVSLAFACGASRVALVGQDCCFRPRAAHPADPAGEQWVHAQMYASGTPYAETTVAIHTEQMRARVDKPTVPVHHVDVLRVPGIDGQEVWTTHSMLSFAHWFAHQPADVARRIVNCSSYGVRIEGIEHADVASVVDGSGEYYRSKPSHSQGASFRMRAVRVLRQLQNSAGHALTIKRDVQVLEWARLHPVLNMWIAPERLRMRREDNVGQAERGHRIAAVIRRACAEIQACARGEL